MKGIDRTGYWRQRKFVVCFVFDVHKVEMVWTVASAREHSTSAVTVVLGTVSFSFHP